METLGEGCTAGKVQQKRGCPEARSGRFSPGRMESGSVCSQTPFFRPAPRQAPGMPTKPGPPSASFLMRGDRGNKQVTQRTWPAQGAQSCGGTRGGPGGSGGQAQAERERVSREDALKELVGQGRGACGAGAAGLGLGGGTAERRRKNRLSSLPPPKASLQPHSQPPHPIPRTEKGFPPVCNSQDGPPEGSVGPAGVDRVTSAPRAPSQITRFPYGDVLGGGQLSQILPLLLKPRHKLPTRDLCRTGRLSTLPEALGSTYGHTINLVWAKGQDLFSS